MTHRALLEPTATDEVAVPSPDRWFTRWILLSSAAAIGLCTRPWTAVAFERLWGPGLDVAALRTSAGLVCVLASALTLVIGLLGQEDHNPQMRATLSTALVVTTLMGAGSVAVALLGGPGSGLRGITMVFTPWIYATAVCAIGAFALAVMRHRRSSRRR